MLTGKLNTTGDWVQLSDGTMTASVATRGAELRSLCVDGFEYIWQGDKASWARSSPILFPVVGRLADGHIRCDGQNYPMEIHGFANTSEFELLNSSSTSCTLCLESSEKTLGIYPYEFRLIISYEIGAGGLTCSARIENLAPATLLANFGFHPGFNWPSKDGAKEAASKKILIEVIDPEVSKIGSMHSEIPLHATSFAAEPIVCHNLNSISATVLFDQNEVVRVETQGTECLGLWSKMDADFICIEPWQGQPEPEGWRGEQSEKPYILQIPANEYWTCAMRIVPLMNR